MNSLVLPIAKYSFYAGNINYESAEKLFQLFDELKCFLRTGGQGWKKPVKVSGKIVALYIIIQLIFCIFTAKHAHIEPIALESSGADTTPCEGLITYEKSSELFLVYLKHQHYV